MRFLVVDDSAVDRRFLTSLLTELGHQADESSGTAGAMDKIKTGNYASVFLDIVMPDIDGYKFLRELRSNQATSNQHVIFCSIKKTPLEIKYGLIRAGANDYLTKPLQRLHLQEALENI